MAVHADRLAATGTPARAWFGAALAVGFVLPYVFADVLDVQRDLYYGIHAATTLALFAAWLRREGRSLSSFLRRRWQWGAFAGAVGGVVTVLAALRAEEASARPDRVELVAALLWRGVVYGISDGLLLAVFPIVVVYAALAPDRRRVLGKIGVAAAALVASLTMTAVYHLGYPEFRDRDLVKPVGGNAAWSVPTLVTASPLAAPIAHAAMHVTAVVHSYETDVFLPPHDASTTRGGKP